MFHIVAQSSFPFMNKVKLIGMFLYYYVVDVRHYIAEKLPIRNSSLAEFLAALSSSQTPLPSSVPYIL